MIWLAVFPTLTVLNCALGGWLRTMTPVVRTFVLATIAVPIVIYGPMPQLHRLRGRLLARSDSGCRKTMTASGALIGWVHVALRVVVNVLALLSIGLLVLPVTAALIVACASAGCASAAPTPEPSQLGQEPKGRCRTLPTCTLCPIPP